jgi:phage tail sheath protein FI
LLPSRCGGIEANCAGAEVGGRSGDDARVVPEKKEGTGDKVIAPASNAFAKVASRLIAGGGFVVQLKSADVVAANIVDALHTMHWCVYVRSELRLEMVYSTFQRFSMFS